MSRRDSSEGRAQSGGLWQIVAVVVLLLVLGWAAVRFGIVRFETGPGSPTVTSASSAGLPTVGSLRPTSPASEPTPIPAAPTAPPATGTIRVGSSVQVRADDGLYVRSGAGVGNEQLALVADGATLQVVGGPTADAAGVTWWQVTGWDADPTRPGWCSGEFLQPTN